MLGLGTATWRIRSLVLLAIVLLAVWVLLAEPVEHERLLRLGELLTGSYPALAALIVFQALLFALGLPGSLMVWVVAPFMEPWAATGVLVAGSVLGALGAWLVARWLGETARARVADHPAFRLLTRASDPFTQCALRVLPGFPHVVVNYGGGVLALPLPGFLGAALVGLTVKWGLYATAVHALMELEEDGGAIGPETVGPLVVLAVFLLGGRWLAMRLQARRRLRRPESR